MKTIKADIEATIENHIENHGLTFLAGAYLINRFGGSDGNYVALALDDQGRVHRFDGNGNEFTSRTLRTASQALAAWREIVDDYQHGFTSSWTATGRFLTDLGRNTEAEPQEAQDWSLEGDAGHEGAVMASIKRQGTRLVLGTDHLTYFETLTIGEDGQAYRTTSTTDGGALSTRLVDCEALELWNRIIHEENFTSRNDGVEAFWIWQGRKARTLVKAA